MEAIVLFCVLDFVVIVFVLLLLQNIKGGRLKALAKLIYTTIYEKKCIITHTQTQLKKTTYSRELPVVQIPSLALICEAKFSTDVDSIRPIPYGVKSGIAIRLS